MTDRKYTASYVTDLSVFGDCDDCGAITGEYCLSLRDSVTRKGKLVTISSIHKSRPRLKYTKNKENNELP